MASRDGFTLLEVLVALTMLALVFVSLPASLIGVVQGNLHARRVTAAVTFAQDKLEFLRDASFASIANGTDQVVDGSFTYTRTWNVAAGPASFTKAVSVTVGWTDKRYYEIAVESVVAEQ